MKATLYDVMWQGEKTFDEVQKYGVEPIRKLLKFIREELTIEWDNTGAYEDIVSLAIEPMAAFADLLEDRLVEFLPLQDKNSPEYINDHIYRAVQLAAELKRRIRDWSLVYGDLSQEIYEESQRTKAEIASTATMVQGKPLDNRNIAMARP